MFCPKCGSQLPDGAKFCAACGAQLGSPAAPAAASKPPRRSRKAPLIAGIGALVVLVAAGVIVWLAFFAPYDIDEKNFPDAALRAAVAATYDADHDGKLSRDEARAVTSMSLSGCVKLSGLGHIFPNVASLTVTGGALTELDTSDLPQLAALDVSSEPLAALDLSGNGALTSLSVPDATQVSGLDATGLREVWLTADIVETNQGDTVTYHSERDAAGRVTAWSFQWETGPVVSGSYTYDDQGRPASVALNNSQSGVTEETYAYDESGRLATIVSTSDYSTQTSTYAYDDAGRLSQVVSETGSTSASTSTTATTDYAYDDAGRLTQSKTTNVFQGSTTAYWTNYVYDEQGRLVREETWTGGDRHGDQLSYAAIFSYDDAGNMVGTSYEGTYTDFLIPESFVYDDQGRVVSASTGDPTGSVTSATYEATFSYDDAGRMVGAESVSTYDGREHVDSYQATYTRRFVAKDAPDPATGFSLIAYKGVAGADTIPLVGITHPATGVVPDGLEVPPYNESVYRGY
ncbi:zinc-ribbon domain-containing protein [Olsenella uli]|uniref:zinc ribbon domain-containing protein n=1 Tax=Olsenella uli TaxID=133926 RepID=UPI00195B24EC|nr:zinc-ribbon domain-containing protein [Olsenella uli]MBM6675263.1 zinc-ribbon domain-containing protein [Olsenella uli]